MIRKYELMAIFIPELEEDAMEKEIEKLKDLISSKGGEVEKVDNWGKRRLAYEIKKKKEGIYVVINFSLPPNEVLNIKSVLKLDENILRFMIIKEE